MKKVVFLVLFVCFHTFAQKSEIYTTKDGAINGYDAVAYFNQNKPVKGDLSLKYHWKEADWFFATADNLKAFTADPEKFAPQYGGYCAYGMSASHKAPTEADAFTISEGKLYLNYNKNVMGTWRKDQDTYIEKANAEWPKLKSKE